MTDLTALSDDDLKELRRMYEKKLQNYQLPGAQENNASVWTQLNKVDEEVNRRYREHQKAVTPIAAQHTEGDAVVFLPFSAYELGNIAEMFKAIMPHRFVQPEEREKEDFRHPFAVFNSGDWAGVCADRFVVAAEEYAKRGGNHSWQEYREMAKRGY